MHEAFGVTLSAAAMSRLVRRLGYAKLSARPRHHAQNALAVEAFRALTHRSESIGDSHCVEGVVH
ncbi:MAG: winged helix-turn-helix domain-containing protein [Rhodobacteraceae bacterium]|nr:winged helix-turn-helix domain-containing protein [Paracoccaceae bacterium]